MQENNKSKLYAIIAEISKLSNDIDMLKKKRDELLDEFKQVQLIDLKNKPLVKVI